MTKVIGLTALGVLTVLFAACGGAAPTPSTPTTAPSASAAPSETASAAPTDQAPAPPSVVRFDDLGVSFAVPPGFHVMGDDDLAARIRASANPRLTAALQSRASQKKAVPLLTLSKDSGPGDSLSLTLTASVLPKDATPAELLAQQQAVMNENLEGFTITDGPRDHPQDNVAGVELADRYGLRGGADRKMASRMRVYVRNGLAFVIVAVWPDGAPRADEAKTLLDGIHFYDAQP